MKCPYQTREIHKPEYINDQERHYKEDITEFGDCVKTECPFYYTIEIEYKVFKEHCGRAERELRVKK